MIKYKSSHSYKSQFPFSNMFQSLLLPRTVCDPLNTRGLFNIQSNTQLTSMQLPQKPYFAGPLQKHSSNPGLVIHGLLELYISIYQKQYTQVSSLQVQRWYSNSKYYLSTRISYHFPRGISIKFLYHCISAQLNR